MGMDPCIHLPGWSTDTFREKEGWRTKPMLHPSHYGLHISG